MKKLLEELTQVARATQMASSLQIDVDLHTNSDSWASRGIADAAEELFSGEYKRKAYSVLGIPKKTESYEAALLDVVNKTCAQFDDPIGIDIGCGIGRYVGEMEAATQVPWFGLDKRHLAAWYLRSHPEIISAIPGMWNHVNKAVPDRSKYPFADRFIVQDAQVMSDIPDNSIACITSTYAIPYTNELLALEAIHRILRPGGRALVCSFDRTAHSAVYDRHGTTFCDQVNEQRSRGHIITALSQLDDHGFKYLVTITKQDNEKPLRFGENIRADSGFLQGYKRESHDKAKTKIPTRESDVGVLDILREFA